VAPAEEPGSLEPLRLQTRRHTIQVIQPLTDGRVRGAGSVRRSTHTRAGWLGVVPSVAAAFLLATLSFASLCLCSDEGVVAQSYLDGCGGADRQQVELAAGVDTTGDVCLDRCLDVRLLAAGTPGDDRPQVAADAIVATRHGPASDRSHLSLLQARPRGSRHAARHLDYTILRC